MGGAIVLKRTRHNEGERDRTMHLDHRMRQGTSSSGALKLFDGRNIKGCVLDAQKGYCYFYRIYFHSYSTFSILIEILRTKLMIDNGHTVVNIILVVFYFNIA